MARIDNLTNFLTDVAESIRTKKGITGKINASEFDNQITSITTGIVPNGVVEKYQVYVGESIALGDFVDFINVEHQRVVTNPTQVNTGNWYYPKAQLIDTNKIMFVYYDSNNNRYGTAIVGVLNNGIIEFGSEYVFNTAQTNYIDACVIENNKVLIAYADSSNASRCSFVVATVSGSIITFGTETTRTNLNATYWVTLSLIDTNKVLLGYTKGSSNVPVATIVISISGMTVTIGDSYTVYTGINNNSGRVFNCCISSNVAAIIYNVTTSSYLWSVTIATINGSTVSYGTTYSINEDSAIQMSIKDSCLIDTNKLLLTGFINKQIIAIVIDILESTVVIGTTHYFKQLNASTVYITMCKTKTNQAIISYAGENTETPLGQAFIMLINGTTITAATNYIFNSSGNSIALALNCLVNENIVIIAYYDYTLKNSYAQAFKVIDTTISDVIQEAWTEVFVKKAITTPFVGIAKTSGRSDINSTTDIEIYTL